jgi:DNA-binding transcriptional MerR regulator
MGPDKWLTLTEVINKSDFNDIEGRRLVKKFGTYLAPRNFGDIVKYPPAAVEAIILIGELYRQGCTTEEIMAILSHKDQQPGESIHGRLQQELGTLLRLQNQACQLMRSTFDMVKNLMSDVAVLTAKLGAAEVEIRNLKEQNQTHRAEAGGQRLEELE